MDASLKCNNPVTPARIGIAVQRYDSSIAVEPPYLTAVVSAGGHPVLLPLADTLAQARSYAAALDGLVVPGGPAVTDGLIGELPEDLDPPQPRRTASDRLYLQAFLEAGKPILGICYGMQLLNAVLGGTIYADVQRQLEGARAHSPKRGAEQHPIEIAPESHLARLLGRTTWTVNTRHLQALATIGRGLRVSARAPDGVIEAIESPDGRLLGVQFHPERMGTEGFPLFRHLVSLAEKFAAGNTERF